MLAACAASSPILLSSITKHLKSDYNTTYQALGGILTTDRIAGTKKNSLISGLANLELYSLKNRMQHKNIKHEIFLLKHLVGLYDISEMGLSSTHQVVVSTTFTGSKEGFCSSFPIFHTFLWLTRAPSVKSAVLPLRIHFQFFCSKFIYIRAWLLFGDYIPSINWHF